MELGVRVVGVEVWLVGFGVGVVGFGLRVVGVGLWLVGFGVRVWVWLVGFGVGVWVELGMVVMSRGDYGNGGRDINSDDLINNYCFNFLINGPKFNLNKCKQPL